MDPAPDVDGSVGLQWHMGLDVQGWAVHRL